MVRVYGNRTGEARPVDGGSVPSRYLLSERIWERVVSGLNARSSVDTLKR
jgi:hypothetical protein